MFRDETLELRSKLDEDTIWHSERNTTLVSVVCADQKDVALHRPNENKMTTTTESECGPK
jgi:hypothetical protein